MVSSLCNNVNQRPSILFVFCFFGGFEQMKFYAKTFFFFFFAPGCFPDKFLFFFRLLIVFEDVKWNNERGGGDLKGREASAAVTETSYVEGSEIYTCPYKIRISWEMGGVTHTRWKWKIEREKKKIGVTFGTICHTVFFFWGGGASSTGIDPFIYIYFFPFEFNGQMSLK